MSLRSDYPASSRTALIVQKETKKNNLSSFSPEKKLPSARKEGKTCET